MKNNENTKKIIKHIFNQPYSTNIILPTEESYDDLTFYALQQALIHRREFPTKIRILTTDINRLADMIDRISVVGDYDIMEFGVRMLDNRNAVIVQPSLLRKNEFDYIGSVHQIRYNKYSPFIDNSLIKPYKDYPNYFVWCDSESKKFAQPFDFIPNYYDTLILEGRDIGEYYLSDKFPAIEREVFSQSCTDKGLNKKIIIGDYSESGNPQLTYKLSDKYQEDKNISLKILVGNPSNVVASETGKLTFIY